MHPVKTLSFAPRSLQITVSAALLTILPVGTFVHEAPTGWSYPKACCSNQDCRQISQAEIWEGPQGYEIAGSGEVLPYSDGRLRESPDGEYHWCSMNGSDTGRTICLFVPPMGF
jgi:hypothetical protein